MNDPGALAELVWASQGVLERLALLRRHAPSATTGPEDDLLDRWCRAVAGGDRGLFRRRLEWSGWTEAEAGRLATAGVPPGLPVPAWAHLLRELLDGLNESSADPTGPGHEAAGPIGSADGDPIPFAEALLPLVRLAERRWWRPAPPGTPTLDAPARADARQFILRRLSRRAADVLLAEFEHGREEGEPAPPPTPDRPGRRDYDAYVGALLRGGWVRVLEEHPVLARQVGVGVQGWIDTMARLTDRLQRDAPRFLEELGLTGPVFPIRNLLLGAGDIHAGGDATVLLTLAGGERIVYKPRSVGPEKAWFRLLERLGAGTGDRPFRCVPVVEGAGYGWMACVEHWPVRERDELRRFYRQSGRLAGLAYVLGSGDLHFENLVASGTEPVLVDLETVLQPQRWAGDPGSGSGGASVLDTGLLPVWESRDGGPPLDLSALGCLSEREMDYAEPTWLHVNTDAMRRTSRPVWIEPTHNRPVLDPDSDALAVHAQEVVGGFREMYRAVEARRDEWLGRRGPPSWFLDGAVRVLARSTFCYRVVLERGTRPALLRDGLAWSLHAESLVKAWLGRSARPGLWGLIPAEQTALLNGEIPRFESAADGTHVRLPDARVVSHAFAAAALDRCRARIAALGDEDLARQCERIRRSIDAWALARREGPLLGPYLAATLMAEP
ncbi:MAG TPA: type 2 lanthipeptide synthetase LanM [Longimicrobiales bacterium]|nr:type 2 lanthipeptide synthetase LanM [Longimicrobiales bacterium]